MTTEEMKECKVGDTVYVVSYFLDTITKYSVIFKLACTLGLKAEDGDVTRVSYREAFTTKEDAVEELTRKYINDLALTVGNIEKGMDTLGSFNKDALNDELLNDIIDSIKSYYKIVKERKNKSSSIQNE